MKKSIISMLLLFAMLLTVVLSGCNDEEMDNSSSPVSEEQSIPAVSETSVEEKLLIPHLGKRDLKGFTLTVLACGKNMQYNVEQFAPEELKEEPINDAVYNRNQLLKNEYNCDIDVLWVNEFTDCEAKVDQAILAGTNEFNICVTGVMTLANIANKGYFYDLLDLEGSNLHLNEAWWDKSANDSMTICNKLFFATGDITFYDEQNTQCIFFNKDMITDHNLENPYQLVYDDKWTLDAMHQMCRKVATPGGDGVMNMEGDDTYGYVGVSFDAYKLIIAAGCPQIERDSNGDPVITMTNEHNVNVFNKVQQFMTDRSCTAYLEQYYRWNDYDNNHKVRDHFYDGQALFLCGRICAASEPEILATTFNYGVLPTPKYDEEQENYIDAVDPYWYYAVAIPKTTEMDIDKVTFVLEAMAYLNKQYVTPQYYEVTLKEKRFRDDDASNMLDLIFANRCVDLSVIFDWNGCIQYYNELLTDNRGVISYMESKGPAMQEAMNESIEKLRGFTNK